MGKRGPKPEGKVKTVWSSDFAYAIGLLVTDGNLSPDGRHISFVSKDIEQVRNFLTCLGLKVKIGVVKSGYDASEAYKVQFGDVLFYKFLQKIGLTCAKSKTMGVIKIPRKYFFDFLRGCFDGDGYTYSYWDKRWKSSFMYYLGFVSAAPAYIKWLQNKILELTGKKGHVTYSKRSSCAQLKYAKKDSLYIMKKMYYTKNVVCLSRKRLKIRQSLAIVGESGV